MKTVFISKLKPLLDAVADEMELYVPKKSGEPNPSEGRGEHYIYSKYEPSAKTAVEVNNIRTCVPAKEFLFPVRELAATFPDSLKLKTDIKPFAVFGLKDCDLRSIEILDKVFLEEEHYIEVSFVLHNNEDKEIFVKTIQGKH